MATRLQKIEVLGVGQQVVLFGVHPIRAGHTAGAMAPAPIRWKSGFMDLALVTAEQIEAGLREGAPSLSEWSMSRPGPSSNRDTAAPDIPLDTPDNIRRGGENYIKSQPVPRKGERNNAALADGVLATQPRFVKGARGRAGCRVLALARPR